MGLYSSAAAAQNRGDTPPVEMPPEISMPTHQAAAAIALRGTGEVGQAVKPELQLGNYTFTLEGRDAGGRLVMASTDHSDGGQRVVTVYRSNSTGALRVAQGKEQDDEGGVRWLKGPEGFGGSQYSVDTQLHPVVRAWVGGHSPDAGPGVQDLPRTTLADAILTRSQAGAASEEFRRQVRILPLKAGALGARLQRLTVGKLEREDIAELSGGTVSRASLDEAMRQEVAGLNKDLAEAGVVPDFSGEPSSVRTDTHPVLGDYTVETYRRDVDGRPVEWHIGRDGSGRVWIERIRFADSRPTPYGTDADLLYSGILTEKPVEYSEYCTGLPLRWRTASGHEKYSDITPFLNELLPIKQYRQLKGIRAPYVG